MTIPRLPCVPLCRTFPCAARDTIVSFSPSMVFEREREGGASHGEAASLAYYLLLGVYHAECFAVVCG